MSKPCCNADCQQGRNCPLRQVNGGESVDDGLPVVMFEQPYRYAEDLFYCVIHFLGLAFLIIGLAGCVGFMAVRFFNF